MNKTQTRMLYLPDDAEVKQPVAGTVEGDTVRPKRFFVYCKVEHPAQVESRRAPCRALVVEQKGLIVDGADDVGRGDIVDMPGYARLYQALDEAMVDAFVTDMTALGPTMILGLFALCVVSGIEMWDVSGGLVTHEQIRAIADAVNRRLDAKETVRDMLSPNNRLS